MHNQSRIGGGMMPTHTAKKGDFVHPDFWGTGQHLIDGDSFIDDSFPGCQFRLKTNSDGPVKSLAVNIRVTGGDHWHQASYRSRCKIEFVGDGEPSTFTGGWIYHEETV